MIFEDTAEVPASGRGSRVEPAPELLLALKDSAENGKSKTITLTGDEAPLLQRQLRAKAVRDQYDVIVRTKADADGNVRFLFRAAFKEIPPPNGTTVKKAKSAV